MKSNNIPIYRRIADELREYIYVNKLARHTLLPSEAELAHRYGSCINTVRKALSILVEEKVIYRNHGQGTFVAPRGRKQKLLLVSSVPRGPEDTYNDFFRFFAGALTETNASDLPFEPLMVELKDFMSNLDEVKLVYPEAAGVIFFRGLTNYERAKVALQRQNLPMLFFGPDFFDSAAKPDCCRIFYRESQVAHLAAEYLHHKNFRKIAFCSWDQPFDHFRLACFQDAWQNYGEILTISDVISRDVAALKNLAQNCDAVYCSRDCIALDLLQSMTVDARLNVPEDLKIMGVDNIAADEFIRPGLTSIDLGNFENGRRAIREFSDYLLSGSSIPFEYDAVLKLIPRRSC